MGQENARVTKVTKGIERVFNIGNFESIRISIHAEDEIEWSTIEERKEKLERVTKNLINDFNKSKEDIMSAFSAHEKKGFYENKLEKKEEQKKVSTSEFDSLVEEAKGE